MLKLTPIAGAIAMLTPAAALAQNNVAENLTVTGAVGAQAHSRVVSLNDLDLRRDNYVRIANSRVRRAAAGVCGVGRQNGSAIPEHQSGCFTEAFDNARIDLNSRIIDQRLS